MDIHFINAYSFDKELADFYNTELERYPEEDWIVFTDGDAMFTANDFGHKIKQVIEANPEYRLFTCLTNRVACPYQVVKGYWYEERMNEHWRLGDALWKKYETEVSDITNEQPLSGVLMAMQCGEALEVGGFYGRGMLGVDNSLHVAYAAAGKKVGLMLGVYMMHYYRNGGANTDHLKKEGE